jgi:hypothetical protein
MGQATIFLLVFSQMETIPNNEEKNSAQIVIKIIRKYKSE